MRLSWLLLIATCTAIEAIDEASRVESQFNSYFMCPYCLEKPPSAKLSVRFASEEVDLGNTIPAYSASIPPYIYYEADPDELYCIVMCDCDAPFTGAPVDSPALIALLTNIKGNNLADCDYMTSYQLPAYAGSGDHRIMILLYQQPKKIDITTPEMQNRHKNVTNFNVNVFASQYGLGECVAGNFFLMPTPSCDCDNDAPAVCSIY